MNDQAIAKYVDDKSLRLGLLDRVETNRVILVVAVGLTSGLPFPVVLKFSHCSCLVWVMQYLVGSTHVIKATAFVVLFLSICASTRQHINFPQCPQNNRMPPTTTHLVKTPVQEVWD